MILAFLLLTQADDELIRELAAEDFEVAGRAAEELAARWPEARVAVERVSRETAERIATRVRRVEEKIKPLLEKLGEDDFDEREAAVKKILRIGRPALPHLRKLFDSRDELIRARAREISEKIRSVKRAPDPEEAKVELLVSRLGEENFETAGRAAEALVRIGPDARPALEKAAHRELADRVLNRIRAVEKRIAPLLEKLAAGDENAGEEILKIGPPALPHVRKAAESKNAALRDRAKELLPKFDKGLGVKLADLVHKKVVAKIKGGEIKDEQELAFAELNATLEAMKELGITEETKTTESDKKRFEELTSKNKAEWNKMLKEK